MQVSVLVSLCLLFSAVCWTVHAGDTKPRSNKRRRKNKHTIRSSSLQPPLAGQLVRVKTDRAGNVTSGLVEVLLDGRYGIVCDDKWDSHDADIVCKQMGFTRGAERAVHQYGFGTERYRIDDILMDEVTCGSESQTIQDCRWVYPSDCTVAEAAGIVCKENTGCPDGWIASPTGCYLLPQNSVSRREFAINKCIKHGGRLVTIETELENHFLSHAFVHAIGPILTGGVKKGGSWKWEKVEESEEEDSTDVHGHSMRHTTRDPVEYTMWFPGWQPGNVFNEPTRKKKERCLFMTSLFEHPNGSDVTLDYLYWQSDQCTSTKKRMSSGFRYMCEKERERRFEGEGCYHGIGTQYRGSASTTEQGTSCMKWTLDTDINPSSYPNSGLGDHNYCRNPDDDERPWCWVQPGNFEFCDILQCPDESIDDSQETQNISCGQNQFMCSDKMCIPDTWLCDHENDCPLGEDEEACEYNLTLFTKMERHSFRDHMVETYTGTTNETCAKYCLEADMFVCRSFTYVPRTRDCLLSDKNSVMMAPRRSRREDLYELTSFLDGCSEDSFMCVNGRCIALDQVCDGVNQCNDASDEKECGTSDLENTEELEVRISGTNPQSGAVEVQYMGEWGLICDDNWDDSDAQVVCRMLGFTGESVAIINLEDDDRREMFLDEVDCSGEELSLDNCTHSGWMNHNCFRWEVAGVQCSNTDPLTNNCDEAVQVLCSDEAACISMTAVCDDECDCGSCTDEEDCEAAISLQDGENPSEGRIQISMGGVIGSVCDDKFDDLDATVVCSSLGYSFGTFSKNGQFPPGTGVIWMDEVDCNGTEDNIFKCPHVERNYHDCGHDEDVGVICHHQEVTPDMEVFLVGGDDEYSGRVEVSSQGERGTICDDKWDKASAQVLCRMLGFSGGVEQSFGPGSEDLAIVLDDVQCTGSEESILECKHSDWKINDCSHDEDVGVVCQPLDHDVSTSEPTMGPDPEQSEDEECIKEGVAYKGRMRQTEYDYECQSWLSDDPHIHKYHNDSMFPDGTVEGASNYCRSPDGDEKPWCYTVDPDERWAYCNIPKCKDDCYSVASEYTGQTSVTKEGHTCQAWAANTPHQHKYHEGNMFPDESVEEAENYCRSPDDDVVSWCYTTNENVRWQYCDVPRCSSSTSYTSNVTCGNRPLELNRQRREVDDSEEEFDDYIDEEEESEEHIKYRKRGRIHGGNIAVYGMNPWQVGIRKRFSTGFFTHNRHHCGGTIINEYWILSAAHCFRDLTKGMVSVRTGDHDHGQVDKYEQEFHADQIIPHELYNKNLDYDYDIALVKIHPIDGRGIIFNDHVQPACLPDDTAEYVPGMKCLISGWGAHEHDSQSDVLRSARVPLVDDRTCSRLYKGEITQNMVCAGYLAGGGDTCTGDSGGPLVCQIDGKYTVMGATSFGLGCGDANAPGVYARVKSLMPWIKRVLNTYG